jgi:hypothetical protein
MKKNRLAYLAIILAAPAVVLAARSDRTKTVASPPSGDIAAANRGGDFDKPVFKAILSGAQAVPEVQSKARADVIVDFTPQFSEAVVRVKYRDLSGPLSSIELRAGRRGKVGPRIVDLLAGTCVASDLALEGVIECKITNADIEPYAPQCDSCGGGGDSINNLVALASAMENGDVYAALSLGSTRQATDTSIRGQIELAISVHLKACKSQTSGDTTFHSAGCSTVEL